MPYREPSEPTEETDPEATAITVLRTRAERLRTTIHVPLLLCGLAGGAVMYIVLRDWQFATRGAHFPWFTAVMAFAPTFGPSLWFAPRLANLVVGRSLPRWRATLAERFGLDPVELAETTRFLE